MENIIKNTDLETSYIPSVANTNMVFDQLPSINQKLSF